MSPAEVRVEGLNAREQYRPLPDFEAMSRKVEMAFVVPIPDKKKYARRRWLGLKDRVRGVFIDSGRRRLAGRVRVSYLWEDQKERSAEEEAAIAVELLAVCWPCMAEGANPYIGQARCETASKPRLYLTLEAE